jgi:hypothetical protein
VHSSSFLILREHKQFAVDTRRSPRRIFRDHSENQIANFLGDELSARHKAQSRNGSRIHREAGSVPADDRLGAHEDEGLLPSGPDSSCENPEEPVKEPDVWSRMAPFEDRELLPQHEIFEQQPRAILENSKNTTEKKTERAEHASVLTSTDCGKQSVTY